MKKIFALTLIVLLTLVFLTGCSSKNKMDEKKDEIVQQAEKILPEEEKIILEEAINEDGVTQEDLDELAKAMEEYQKAFEAYENET